MGKIPPSAIDLEDSVLGAILNEGNKSFELVRDIFQDKQVFYSPKNEILWQEILNISFKSLPIDLLTISHHCSSKEELKEVWSPYELSKLTMGVVSTATLEGHCRIILERFMARELINTCQQLNRSAYALEDIFDTLQFAESAIFDLCLGKSGSDYKSAAKIADENIQKLISHINNPNKITGVPSGIESLDTITGGWQDTDLIILAARPGLGKTALALNFAKAAAESGEGVGFFTLEMGDTQLMNRLLSMQSLVPLTAIRKGNLNPLQLELVADAAKKIGSLPLFIDEEAAISTFDLRTKARKMKTKHDIGFIIVDYLQLMKGEKTGNREREISSISQGLKALAKDLKIPVMALSQLSRDVEKRGKDAKAQLSDLRESGSIEQDANLVLFLERLDYQKTESEKDPDTANTAELRLAKHRDGILCEIALDTDLNTQRFFEPKPNPPIQEYYNPNAGFNRSSQDIKDTGEVAPY